MGHSGVGGKWHIVVAESTLTSPQSSQASFLIHPRKGNHFFPGQPGSTVVALRFEKGLVPYLVTAFSLHIPLSGPVSSLQAWKPPHWEVQACSDQLLSTGHGVGPPPQFRPFSSDDTQSSDVLLNFWSPEFPHMPCHGLDRDPTSHCPWSGTRGA